MTKYPDWRSTDYPQMMKRFRKGDRNIACFAFSWSVCCGWWASHSNSKNNRDKNNLNLKCNKVFCSVHFQDIDSHVNTIANPNMLHGDGSAKCIYEWKSKRYQMENILSAHRLVSTSPKENVGLYYNVWHCLSRLSFV